MLLSFCWHEPEIQTEVHIRLISTWKSGQKGKHVCYTYCQGLFSQKYYWNCVQHVDDFFFSFLFNRSLLYLFIETAAVGNLESMCSLEMSISTSFILLTALFQRRAHPCPWVLLTMTLSQTLKVQALSVSDLTLICGGNPAFHDNRLSPLQNPYQQSRCGTMLDNTFKGSFLHKAHLFIP